MIPYINCRRLRVEYRIEWIIFCELIYDFGLLRCVREYEYILDIHVVVGVSCVSVIWCVIVQSIQQRWVLDELLVRVTVFWRQYHVKSKKIVKQCHGRPTIVEISRNLITVGLKSRHQKSVVFLNQIQVDFLSYFSQYLEFRVQPRLYIHLKELFDATRVFLVVILSSSRVRFRPLFTSGVPCDNSEMNVHDRSWGMRHSIETVFQHHILSVTTGDALI